MGTDTRARWVKGGLSQQLGANLVEAAPDGAAVPAGVAASTPVDAPKKRRWTAGATAIFAATALAAILQFLTLLLQDNVGWFAAEQFLGLSDEGLETAVKVLSLAITTVLSLLALAYANGTPVVLNHIYNVTNNNGGQQVGLTKEELQAELANILNLLFSNKFDELGERLPAQGVARIREWLEDFRAANRADLSPITDEINRVHQILDRIVNQAVTRIPAADMSFLEKYAENALRRDLDEANKKLSESQDELATMRQERDDLKKQASADGAAILEGSNMLSATKPILDGVEALAAQIRKLNERPVNPP